MIHISGHGFHSDSLTSLQINQKDPNIIITGSVDSTAKISNIVTGKVLSTLSGHQDSVEAVDFCSSMPLAATGSLDQSLKIWDITNSQQRSTYEHKQGVTKLLWHPTQPLIFTASLDGCIRLFDGRTSKCEQIWKGHKNSILDLTLSSDGNIILSGADDCSALVFKR